MKRLLIALLVLAVGIAWIPSVAHAAAPRIIIISGKALRQQVVISDWRSIVVIVEGAAAARPASRQQLARRPELNFSMFWGPQWNEYLRSGKPATGSDHGRPTSSGGSIQHGAIDGR
jgi:hypothetical protein